MKISVLEDFRGIKKGEVFDFSLLDSVKSLCIVGANGCGKSSLFQALRGISPKNTKSLHEDDFALLGVNIKAEHTYDNIIFFDRIKDCGTDFRVAYNASNYVESGGFAADRLSHGQGSLSYLGRFLRVNKEKIEGGNVLIVLDEIDLGFSLDNMSKAINIVNNLISKGVHVIYITHNPFLIRESHIVYDFEAREFRSASKYLSEKTGFTLNKTIQNAI